MTKSTERLAWIGGAALAVVGVFGAVMLATKKSTATTPSGGGQGVTRPGGGGIPLILPGGHFQLPPGTQNAPGGGLILPNGLFLPPFGNGGGPTPQTIPVSKNGPFNISGKVGDKILVDLTGTSKVIVGMDTTGGVSTQSYNGSLSGIFVLSSTGVAAIRFYEWARQDAAIVINISVV